MFKWFKKKIDEKSSLETGIPLYEDYEDKFTLKDFLKSLTIFILALLVINGFGFIKDKISCAYTGYTYEKPTKRPIFSECLIQMKDGSYVPLERYINRVLTFNDLGNVDQ